MKTSFLFFLTSCIFATSVFAKSEPVPRRYIRDCDILYKKHIVRSINLQKFNNEELFGETNLLVSVLLDAVKRGELKPYKTAHLKEELSSEEFWERLKIPYEQPSVDYTNHMYTEEQSDWEKEWEAAWGKREPEKFEEDVIEDQYYLPSQLSRIEFGENLLVDNVRSDIYFDPQYITIFIPSEINPRGIHEPVASFNFYDCARVFKNDKRAYAENPLMNGKDVNFTDVFLLRLYKSYIVKLGRIDDLYFDQIYSNPKDAFMASKRAEHKVAEYLHKLFNPK